MKGTAKQGSDARLTLPVDWTGKRYFTPSEWARLRSYLRANPDKTLVDAIAHYEQVPF